jgi:hypothetical protein
VLLNGAALGFITSGQGVAFVDGDPDAASVTAALAGNTAITTALGGNPPILAIEELGATAGTGGAGMQTATCTTDFKVLLNDTDLGRDLLLGFYGGQPIGTGVTGVSLDVQANGTDVVNQTFASAAAAAAYFKDNPVHLGSLADPSLASGSLDLTVTLQVTTGQSGGGFFGGLIVGG